MRRNRINIGLYPFYFITTTMVDWLHLLLDDSYYTVLSESMNFCCDKYNARVYGYVWMPNHIHCLLYFEDSLLMPSMLRDFKKFTSGQIRRKLEQDKNKILRERLSHEVRTQQYKIWMDRYDAVPMWKREYVLTKLQYMHDNPVKRSIVTDATDYKYSSARFYSEKPQLDIVKLSNIAEIL